MDEFNILWLSTKGLTNVGPYALEWRLAVKMCFSNYCDLNALYKHKYMNIYIYKYEINIIILILCMTNAW